MPDALNLPTISWVRGSVKGKIDRRNMKLPSNFDVQSTLPKLHYSLVLHHV